MKGLIFTYLLTYGGAIIAPFMPFVGLCIYVCFGIIKPTQTWSFSVPPGSYSKIIAASLILGWILKGFGTWNLGKSKSILIYFGGFTVWAAFSLFISASNTDVASYFVGTVFKIFLPFMIGISLIDSIDKVKALAWVIVLSLGFIAFEQNSYYLSTGVVPGNVGMNLISHEMTLGVALAFFLGLYSEKPWQKWLCWLVAALLCHVPLFHMSRGAMIGLAVSGAIAVYTIPKTRQTIGLLFLGLVVVSVLAGPSVVEEFSTIFVTEEARDNSAQSRIKLWADNLSLALSNPFFGVGPGHWPLYAEEFGWFAGKQGHGLWTQLAAETGFIGAAFLLMFYVSCIMGLWKLRKRLDPKTDWLMAPTLGTLAAICGWVTEAQFGSFWSLETPYYIVLLGAATLKVAYLQEMTLMKSPPCKKNTRAEDRLDNNISTQSVGD